MGRTKSAREIAEKWSRVAPGREQDFRTGIEDPDVDWAKAAKASEETYKQGVQEAIARNAFGKGIEKTGTEKWRRKAVEIGATRWGPGVRAATEDMEAGVAPYAELTERLKATEPPRAPRGDERNFERMAHYSRAYAKLRRKE